MADMLDGKTPVSIRRAVFMAEWAYLDGNLDYERDFCEPILKDVTYMKRWMTANNLSQCSTDLKNTHWTQETEELCRKWNKTKEEIDNLKQNVIIIK